MSRTIRAICLFLVLFLSVGASAKQSPEYAPTTDSPIDFYDIPWDISDADFKEKLASFASAFSSSYTDRGEEQFSSLDTPSVSFGDGRILPVAESLSVKSRTFRFETGDSRTPLCSVAGHSVLRMHAAFYRGYPTRLYGIDITLSPNQSIAAADSYNDLRDKLSALYATPYEYPEKDAETGFSYNYSVWFSSDGSAVYLKHTRLPSGTEIVSLHYGLYTSFDTFADIENQSLAESEKARSDALNSIADDSSGL